MIRGSGVGARTFAFAYNPQGFLATITDPIGRTAQFAYDVAGRVIGKTLPDGRVVDFGYDAAGNVTSLTPPGRPAHTFGYSDRDELTLETPPAVPGTGPSSFSYNLDLQAVTTTRPDTRSVSLGYDGAGRPTSRSFATAGVTTGTDTLTYDSAGRVASVAAASGVTTSYTYAGSLLTSESWAGATAGSVAFSYDTSFRLASLSVNGANTMVFGYDSDSLITSAGALAIARDPQHGLATGSTLGVVGTTTGYNAFGEATSYAASANATPLYNVSYVRDGLGRISQKTETVGGVTDTHVYTYDPAGQVTLVTKNGAAVESYGYDSNGNRVSATVAGSSVIASYDAQDRLTAHGATSFAYNAAGELSSKTAGAQVTTYQYDAVGNLLGVTLPSGTTIAYVVDGRDRRVGKRVNGTLVQGFLYGDALRPVAELDGTGALVSRFVYAGRHAPAYVIKGGVAHRIVTDHLGSVRLVVNATTGAIAQRIDYDTFGSVLADTSPGFQPFGFAGGIHDGATGLVRFGARDYDAVVGRWTAKDPIGFDGGDSGLYRYARNNPVNLVDPSGLDNWDTVAGAFDQLNEDLKLGNPIILLSIALETALVAAFEGAGFDPGPRHVTHQWRDVVRPPPPPFVDSMSADYAKGELITQCAGIVAAAVGGVSRGVGAGVAALEKRLARNAAVAAQKAADDLAAGAAKRARQEALSRALRGVEPVKGQGGGSGGMNPLGKKGTRRG